MAHDKQLEKEAMAILKATSRTFYIPITMLKQPLKLTVGTAYLCMRAIDEIEDHETLSKAVKSSLLQEIKVLLEAEGVFDNEAYQRLLAPYVTDLPDVTVRLADWLAICPAGITGKVRHYTAEMADGMAYWVRHDWYIKTEEDLDDYTYYVAGLVGVMLSDIWYWYDGTQTDRELAIGFGKGLQAVNILRNQDEDYQERGVLFIPEDWGRGDIFAYARHNLNKGHRYLQSLHTRTIVLFCKIPLYLAQRTLKAMEQGKEKISRDEVAEAVAAAEHESS